jgi:hypothetical protein
MASKKKPTKKLRKAKALKQVKPLTVLTVRASVGETPGDW